MSAELAGEDIDDLHPEACALLLRVKTGGQTAAVVADLKFMDAVVDPAGDFDMLRAVLGRIGYEFIDHQPDRLNVDCLHVAFIARNGDGLADNAGEVIDFILTDRAGLLVDDAQRSEIVSITGAQRDAARDAGAAAADISDPLIRRHPGARASL